MVEADQQIGQSAEPHSGGRLVQGCKRQQWHTVFQTRHRVAGHHGSCQDARRRKQEVWVAVGARNISKNHNSQRRGDRDRAGEDEIGAADFT
jgi:hypothetical protein